MNNIVTEEGLVNIDPEGDRYKLNMRQRLDTIKRHPAGKDLFICPDDIQNEIGLFLNAYKIPYQWTKNLTKINPNEIKRQMDRYHKIDVFSKIPTAYITPFDNQALFEWSKQLFGDTEDPAYTAYLDHVDKIMDAYYKQYYKPYYGED